MRLPILVFLFLTIFCENNFASSQQFPRSYASNRLIIKFYENVSTENQLQILDEFGGHIVTTFMSNKALLIQFKDRSIEKTHHLLSKRSEVAYVEMDRKIYVDALVPNDIRFVDQYAHEKINTSAAWQSTVGNQDTIVAVIDTGVSLLHPDLMQNIGQNQGEIGTDTQGLDKRSNGIDDDHNGFIDDWRGWDFVNADNDPSDDSIQSHGSHCAGIIGAKGNNGIGIAGINWDISLLPIKVMDNQGGGYLSHIVLGIEYAIKQGAKIINLSFGDDAYSETLFDAIKAAEKKGVLFVTSAGNKAEDGDRFAHYPSSFFLDNIISVAATSMNDSLADFSNFGSQTVHLGAPGSNILSTIWQNNDYNFLSGTSMAAPHVAGVAALIKSRFKELTPLEIKERILYSVDMLPSLMNQTSSNGRLNAAKAISAGNENLTPPKNIVILKTEPSSVLLGWDEFPLKSQNQLRYEARFLSRPIINETDWNEGRPLVISGILSGTDLQQLSQFKARPLPLSFKGFIAIKTKDFAGNTSKISESIDLELPESHIVFEQPNPSMANFEATGTWGLEYDDKRKKDVFSDSPDDGYMSFRHYSLTLKEPIALNSLDREKPIIFCFMTRYALDSGSSNNGSYAYVEISEPHKNAQDSWITVAVLKGYTNWDQQCYSIHDFLKSAMSFKFRFRMSTQMMGKREGILVDDIVTLSADM